MFSLIENLLSIPKAIKNEMVAHFIDGWATVNTNSVDGSGKEITRLEVALEDGVFKFRPIQGKEAASYQGLL